MPGERGDIHNTMTYNSRESSSNKSYLGASRLQKEQAKGRKSSVKDSLSKFLHDCDNEDLIMAAVTPNPKTNMLSVTDHDMSPMKSPLMSPKGERRTASSKSRRKDSHHKHSSDRDRSNSLHSSEHGTPATQRSSLDDLTDSPTTAEEGSSSYRRRKNGRREAKDYDDDDDVSVSSEEGTQLLSPTRSISRRSGGPPNSNHRSPGRQRPAMQRRASERSSRSSTGDRSSRGGDRSVGRERPTTTARPRRTKSDAAMPPRRTKSDAGLQASSSRRSQRSMDRGVERQLSHQGGALERRLNRQPSIRSAAGNGGGGDDSSVMSGRSTMSSATTRSRRSSLGLDAGPLNAFLNADPRAGSSSVVHVADDEEGSVQPETDEKFLNLRKSRQDQIMQEALKEKWKAKKKNAGDDDDDNINGSQLLDGECGSDEDQPMLKQKTNPLQYFAKGLRNTGKVSVKTAKGTVNAVRDPKRAAKKVGGFAKDVGNTTVKMALDPTLAAKTAVSLGKGGVKGTLKLTKNVGTGVAKGGYGLTKTVAKTGLGATTMVAGTVIDGAGKVVNGATGLIFKNGKLVEIEDGVEYDASKLESRRQETLLDRFARDPDEENEEGKDTHVRQITPRTNSGCSSLLIPTTGSTRASWDY